MDDILYIYITFAFINSADTFIQSNLQIRNATNDSPYKVDKVGHSLSFISMTKKMSYFVFTLYLLIRTFVHV